MAGFLDEWRKPSRLLQDVKTKSIERTLLPLIKQVSESKEEKNLRRHQQNENEMWKVLNFLRFIHVCGMENWMESENEVLWMRRGIVLVFVGFYFKIPEMSVNYIGCWTPLERVFSFSLTNDARHSHSSYHNISVSTSTIIGSTKIWKTRINLYFFAKLAP